VKGLLKVYDGMMYGYVSSLLYHQHFQDGLYTAEKHLLYTVLETLIYEKRRNLGMLSTNALPFTMPQTNDCERKITEKKKSQNITGHNIHNTRENNTNENKRVDNVWINKGRQFKRRHSYPTSTTQSNMDINLYAILGESNEENNNDNENESEGITGDIKMKIKKQQQQKKMKSEYDVEEMSVESVEAYISGCKECAKHNDELEEILGEYKRMESAFESLDNEIGEGESKSMYYELITHINKQEYDYVWTKMEERLNDKINECEKLRKNMIEYNSLQEKYNKLKAEVERNKYINNEGKLKKYVKKREKNAKKSAEDAWKEAMEKLLQEKEERRNRSRYRT